MDSAVAFAPGYAGRMTLSVGVILLFMPSVLYIGSFAQINPEGYISIDCGSSGHSIDPITQLLWVEDEQYEISGSNGQIQNTTALLDDYGDCINSNDYCEAEIFHDNFEALKTFRYFSEEPMRSKYCYALPLTTNNISFLIRAMFLHGNASELQLPIQFEVYVNASLWAKMNFTDSAADDLYAPRVRESIFFSPPGGNTTYICLVPKQGVPFISSLELRQFDSAGLMYTDSFDDFEELFFTNIARWNFGASSGLPTVRYPDDAYDRLWHNVSTFYDGNGPTRVFSETPVTIQKSWSSIGPGVNSVPSKVMESAYLLTPQLYSNLITSTGKFDIGYFFLGTQPGTFIYSIFYFADNTNATAIQQISLDNKAYPSFTITSEPAQHSYFHVLDDDGVTITFSNSSVLNAMEVYVAKSILQRSTYENHVYVMNFIKKTLNMTSWQGDPCTPVSYDGIRCILTDLQTVSLWTIITLTLSNLDNVSGLTSTLFNNTAWHVGDFAVVDLSITHSNVDSNLFKSLLQNFIPPRFIRSLNMSFGNISKLPDNQWWQDLQPFSSPDETNVYGLDLSYNKLTENPCLGNISVFQNLNYLNLSNNMITGPFSYGTCYSNLNLSILILSNNFFSGNLPSSLSDIFEKALSNFLEDPYYGDFGLVALDISNNNFSGDFPESFFRTAHETNYSHDDYIYLPMSLIADNNSFSGSLNLTAWYQQLQHYFVHYNSSNSLVLYKLFSFKDNNIKSIYPHAEEFESKYSLNASILIQYFNTYSGGILLHGNPYCKDAKILFHRYLCRNSTNDKSYEVFHHKRSKVPFYVGIPGAILLLIVGCIGIIIIVRLHRKVKVLQQFQQELLNRKVQPPFFLYQELKTATRDFHSNNKLGSGAFGAVYKAVLPDKTIVAVKKLFVAQESSEQVLNDFLNEVVLLTGIKHRNLIQLLGCCLNNKERILVYEYVDQGNLATALWGHGNESKAYLDWHQRLNICIEVARGLSYLHEELQPRIIHRDVKALNVLLDKNFNPKIADFGLAKSFHDEDTRVDFTIAAFTKGYVAPEYVIDGMLTEKADIYSFGVLMLEIVSGRQCIDLSKSEDNDRRVYLKQWAEDLQKHGNILELLDPDLRGKCDEEIVRRVINIAFLCLNKEHKERPLMSEVVVLLTAEMTSKTVNLDLLKKKAAMMQSKENVTSFELEDRRDHNYVEGAGSSLSGWGWTDLDEGQTQTGESEEDILVLLEKSNSIDSYYKLTSKKELRSQSSNILNKTRTMLKRVGSKLTTQS